MQVDPERMQCIPDDDIRLTGGVNGLRAPDQAAAAAQPYLGLMLNLMDPVSRSSVLFNEIRGKQGGKKASDSGKNEQHGDGERRKPKQKNRSTN